MANRISYGANAYSATLTAELGPVDTVLNVNDTDGLPASGSFYLTINDTSNSLREYVYVPAGATITGTTIDLVSTSNRYLEGSAAGSGLTQPIGSPVEVNTVAQYFEDVHDRATRIDDSVQVSASAPVSPTTGDIWVDTASLGATYAGDFDFTGDVDIQGTLGNVTPVNNDLAAHDGTSFKPKSFSELGLPTKSGAETISGAWTFSTDPTLADGSSALSKTEGDAAYVGLTGAQDVGGVKNFTDGVKVEGTELLSSQPSWLGFHNEDYVTDDGTRIYILPSNYVTTGVGGVLKIFGDPFQNDQVEYRDLGIYFSADQKSDTGYHGNGVFWLNSKVGNSSTYALQEPDIAISFHDGNEVAARFTKLGDGAGAGTERAITVIGPAVTDAGPTLQSCVLEVQGDVAFNGTDELRWKSTSGSYNSLIDFASDSFDLKLRAQAVFSSHYLSAGGVRGGFVVGSTTATGLVDDTNARLEVVGNLVFDNTADRKIRWYDASGLDNSLDLGQARFGVSVNNAEYLAVKNGGSVVIGHTAAVLTTATRGFLEMPHMAGTPTGTPVKDANKTALVIDITGEKLWANFGGTWKSVAFA